MFACNGILFNHESPRRGETFVTRKVVQALCRIKYKKQKILYLGNIYSKRDWGHAKEYVEAMWLMLKQKKPEDFVISTGYQLSIKQFINIVLKELDIKVIWKGKGLKEKAIDENGKIIIACDKSYYRPLEVNTLLGSSKKALKKLKWKPRTKVKDLIKEMISEELNTLGLS